MVSKEKRKHRLPTGYTRNEIVRLLRKKENQKIKSKDLQNKIGISKPVFIDHMKKLESEGAVISIKEGREKYYILSENIYKIPERRIDILASNYSLFTNNELAFLNFDNKEKFYSEIGEKLNAVLIYSALKSIETGENWINAIDTKEFTIMLLHWIIQSIHSDKTPDKLNEPIELRDFKQIRAILKKSLKKGLNKSLKPHYNTLQKMHPTEFEIMNYSFEKPQLNWQKHYAEMNKKK